MLPRRRFTPAGQATRLTRLARLVRGTWSCGRWGAANCARGRTGSRTRCRNARRVRVGGSIRRVFIDYPHQFLSVVAELDRMFLVLGHVFSRRGKQFGQTESENIGRGLGEHNWKFHCRSISASVELVEVAVCSVGTERGGVGSTELFHYRIAQYARLIVISDRQALGASFPCTRNTRPDRSQARVPRRPTKRTSYSPLFRFGQRTARGSTAPCVSHSFCVCHRSCCCSATDG